MAKAIINPGTFSGFREPSDRPTNRTTKGTQSVSENIVQLQACANYTIKLSDELCGDALSLITPHGVVLSLTEIEDKSVINGVIHGAKVNNEVKVMHQFTCTIPSLKGNLRGNPEVSIMDIIAHAAVIPDKGLYEKLVNTSVQTMLSDIAYDLYRGPSRRGRGYR